MMTLEGRSRWGRDLHLRLTAAVASANVFINTVRPDPAVSWQMRLPRICWEACIWTVARAALMQQHQQQQEEGVLGTGGGGGSSSSGILFLLLAWMLAGTAVIDIFLWGPLFATLASFETCRGGGWFSNQPRICVRDYAKGIGRLVVRLRWRMMATMMTISVSN
jgi:hypothetical protein